MNRYIDCYHKVYLDNQHVRRIRRIQFFFAGLACIAAGLMLSAAIWVWK